MELKSRNFTFKEPHVAREPQVADRCPRRTRKAVKVRMNHSWKRLELLIGELGVQNSQFRQWFKNIRENLASY